MSEQQRGGRPGSFPGWLPDLSMGAAAVLAAWLFVGVILAWLSAACLFGEVEHDLAPEQIRGGALARATNLPALPRFWPGELAWEAFEDDVALAPKVETPAEVRKEEPGAYAVVVSGGEGRPRATTLYFTATDGSLPRRNGRSYTIRYPRRSLPATWMLLFASWSLLPAAAYRWSKHRGRSVASAGVPVGVAAWSLLVCGALYSAFAAQAWLEPSNVHWLLMVGAVGLAPGLDGLFRSRSGDRSFPTWLLWVAGLATWSLSSSVAGSSYASVEVACTFAALSIWGSVLYLGLRRRLVEADGPRAPLLLTLFVFAAGLSLARQAGFDLEGIVRSLGLGGMPWHGIVNPWTTKFMGHWLLVLAWCTLAAISLDRRMSWRAGLVVATLSVFAVAVNGSKSAAVALIMSTCVAGLAFRWPTAVRRLVVLSLIVGVLLAPALAAIPWGIRTAFPLQWSDGALGELELDVRGGMWEHSRRFIAGHPVVGWGFGATGSLPGQELSLSEALDLGPEAASDKLSSRRALAGGHPHNAALLAWLDMGLVGALLVAGLVTATGRSIEGVATSRLGHAALLGLLTVNAVMFTFNYPAWEPEVLSILWMSVALASSVLGTTVAARRRSLRDTVLVVVIVGLGCVALVHEQVSRRMTVRTLRGPETVLDRDRGVLTVGERSWPLEHGGTFDGDVRLVEPVSGTTVYFQGWALGNTGDGPEGPVLVFVGTDLKGVVWPERPTPEVFKRAETKDVRALTSGFVVPVDREHLDRAAPVTLVALDARRAFAKDLPPFE